MFGLVTNSQLLAALNAIATVQARQTATLAAILTQGKTIMASVADVQADVTAQTTVIGSAVTLLQGLSAQLAAAGTDPAALDAIKASLDANTAALAAAVVANTPGAPAPAQATQQAQAAVKPS
jgi:hypothetical protein